MLSRRAVIHNTKHQTILDLLDYAIPAQSARPHPRKQCPQGQVDVAREMTDLSVNQIRHELVTRALQRYYSGISAAIVGRNR